MLFFRIAEDPKKKKEYEDSIIFFLEFLKRGRSVILGGRTMQEADIGGFTITFDEAKKYYSEALKNRIDVFDLKFFSNDEKEKFKNIIYQYFINPTDAGNEILIDYIQDMLNADLLKFCSVIVYLNEFTDKYTKKLIASLDYVKKDK